VDAMELNSTGIIPTASTETRPQRSQRYMSYLGALKQSDMITKSLRLGESHASIDLIMFSRIDRKVMLTISAAKPSLPLYSGLLS
jgi:hypothetical protein